MEQLATVIEDGYAIPVRSTPLVQPPRVHSWFGIEIFRRGKCVFLTGPRRNLSTDTASGFTNRRDFQAKAFGGPSFAPVATCVGSATSVTATSLTNTGASFPTAGQGLAGYIVSCGPNTSGAGSSVYGMIQSNTGTVLTVDQWYAASGLPGAAGTTPNGTCTYQVLPVQMPAGALALSTDATAPAATDTTLASEITTNGLARVWGSFSHTAAATTFVLTNTYTCTGGSNTINKECVGGSIVAAKGVMPFESAEPTPPTLANGDTLAQTVTVTIN